MTATLTLTLEEVREYQHKCRQWANNAEQAGAAFWLEQLHLLPSYEYKKELADTVKECIASRAEDPFPKLLIEV